MCLSLVALQDPQVVTYRIEGASESQQSTTGHAAFTPSNASVAYVRVTAIDSAGGVVLDVTVDSARMEHRPPEVAQQLPPGASAPAAGTRFRLYIAPGAERAVAVGPPAPTGLAQATATLAHAYNRWPSEVREDTLSGEAGRTGFGRSTWTTRREFSGTGTTKDPFSVRAHRVSTGTGPAGGNLVAEAVEQIAIVRDGDGLPASTEVNGSLSGMEVVASNGQATETRATWRYLLTRLKPSRARPAT